MTRYIVKENPKCRKEEVKWVFLDGKQFYSLLQSEEGQGRYFIHLTDDIDYESEEIYIEAAYEEYREWKAEHDAHTYLKRVSKEIKMFSLDARVAGGDEPLGDTIQDMTQPFDEKIIEENEIERLRDAVAHLSLEERFIVEALYFGENPMTQRELAKELGIAVSTLNERKSKIFEKIKRFFRTK